MYVWHIEFVWLFFFLSFLFRFLSPSLKSIDFFFYFLSHLTLVHSHHFPLPTSRLPLLPSSHSSLPRHTHIHLTQFFDCNQNSFRQVYIPSLSLIIPCLFGTLRLFDRMVDWQNPPNKSLFCFHELAVNLQFQPECVCCLLFDWCDNCLLLSNK